MRLRRVEYREILLSVRTAFWKRGTKELRNVRPVRIQMSLLRRSDFF